LSEKEALVMSLGDEGITCIAFKSS
jgi:hypothetical protein